MKRIVAAGALVLLTSCSPTASATTTPTSVGTARIHCKLPIGNGQSMSGFITYPEGTFTPDPASDPATNPYRGPNGSSISWSFAPTYDWPATRWLPISRPLLSPDGAAYAYEERVYPPVGPTPVNGPGPGPIGTRIHLVDVATNKNRILIDGPTLWSVVAYRNQVVYMIHPCYEGCGSDSGGLWTLDPATGAIQQIVAPDPADPSTPTAGLTQHLWTLIGPDAAWAGDPTSGGLARLDLATRSISIWFTVGVKALDPAGFDQVGHPIVRGEPNYNVPGSTGGGAWIVTAPGVATRIAPDAVIVSGAVADTHGVWVEGLGSFYLVTPDGRSTDVMGLPGTGDRNLAGPCA